MFGGSYFWKCHIKNLFQRRIVYLLIPFSIFKTVMTERSNNERKKTKLFTRLSFNFIHSRRFPKLFLFYAGLLAQICLYKRHFTTIRSLFPNLSHTWNNFSESCYLSIISIDANIYIRLKYSPHYISALSCDMLTLYEKHFTIPN